MVTLSASSPTTYSLLMELDHAGTIELLEMSLRGAWQCEAVLALRPSGKSKSTELWILLASWRVTLRKFVASTMRTCLLVCIGLPPSPIVFHHVCVTSPMAPVVSKTRGSFVKGRPWSPASSSAFLCVPSLTVCRIAAATRGFIGP